MKNRNFHYLVHKITIKTSNNNNKNMEMIIALKKCMKKISLIQNKCQLKNCQKWQIKAMKKCYMTKHKIYMNWHTKKTLRVKQFQNPLVSF